MIVLDKRNMLILWLEEKIARRELTQAEADDILEDQEGQAKTWTGPIKDGLGTVTLLRKIAKDFASWKGAAVRFTKSSAGHDLVIFKGWAGARKLVPGARYRLDNPKMIELQIGRPGILNAAKESARFGIILVVAVDLADYLFRRDRVTLGQLLGTLTVDVPSALLASALGGAAGALLATEAGMALIGGFALGPVVVAFAVAVGAGYVLFRLDQHFEISKKLGKMYDSGLDKLAQVWHELGNEAEARYKALANSNLVLDLQQDIRTLSEKIGKQADMIRFVPTTF